MKTRLFPILLALPLIGCVQGQINTGEMQTGESSFTIDATIIGSRTTLDGKTVSWENGDALFLNTTDGTWGTDAGSVAEFIYNDGIFSSDNTIPDGTYTFNAIYSAGQDKGKHMTSGSTNTIKAIQSQDCSTPTAHVKYDDALVGQFTMTAPMTQGSTPVEMSHIYALMRVDIVNGTGKETTFTRFSMSAEDACLNGDFTIDFQNAKVSPAGNNGESVAVELVKGTTADGATLPVYFITAPVENYSGTVILSATDTEGNTYTQSQRLADISFLPGTLNTATFSVSSPDNEDEIIDRSGWTIEYCNSQEQWYNDELNWFAPNIMDDDNSTYWSTEYDNPYPTEDDYDYDDRSGIKARTGQTHVFTGRRDIGDVLLVIDLGENIEVHQVGIVHDNNGNITECEFGIARDFSFSTVRDGGTLENYSTLAEGNSWTTLMKTQVSSEKGVTLWFAADTPATGRYLKVRPTASKGQNQSAFGLAEIYIRGSKAGN